MTEITHSHQDGAPSRYRHPPKFGEPEYLSIGAEAKKIERGLLLGMLSAFLASQRARAVPADKILAALNDWIALRLSTLDMTKEGPR